MSIVPVIGPPQATDQDLEQAYHHHDLTLNLQAQGHLKMFIPSKQ